MSSALALRRWTLLASLLVLEWLSMTPQAEDTFVVRSWQTEDGLPQNSGTAIVQTSDGYLWVGTFNGLVRFNGTDFTRFTIGNTKELPNDDINELYADRAGRLWIGTEAGLVCYARGRFTHWSTPERLSRAPIYSFAEQPDGALIVTTYHGVWRLANDQATELDVPNAQWPTTKSLAAAGPDQTVWVAHNEGLYRLEGDQLRWNTRLKEPIRLLVVGRDGTIWCVQRGAAVKWKPGEQPHDAGFNVGGIRGILETRQGDLWVASSENGLSCWRDGQMTAITQDGTGAIWVGTRKGLNRLVDGKIQSFFAKDGVAADRIHCLFADKAGTLWIGTAGAGLTRYQEGRFATVNSHHGLHGDVVAQILEDDAENLWIGSTTGICRASKRSLHDVLDGRSRRVACTVYGREDGMRAAGCPGGSQPACAKTRDGRLWFSTSAGITVADPRQVRRTELPPPVHIERVFVDGVAIETGLDSAGVLASGLPPEWEAERNKGEAAHGSRPVEAGSPSSEIGGGKSALRTPHSAFVKIPPGANRVEFHCAALNFTTPEQAQYKFWLEGYEDNWQEAGTRRVAYYSQVPPGRYRFHVTAANADGIWNESPAMVGLVVEPTLRQTWWYRPALVLTGFCALYAFYRNRISEFKRARTRQAAFARQLIESQEQERKRIAAELHDGLGQSLLVIRNRSKLGLADSSTPEMLREQMEHISGLSASAVEEIRNIAQNLRPYQLVRREAQAVFFCFVDNGRGFECQAILGSNGKSGGLGLRGIVERLRILGSEPEFQSHPGRGTTVRFTVRVPPGTGEPWS